MANDAENVFKILVATDNHVGYLEKDQIRGGDSLEAFEEVLKIGQEQQVDFILLGGDLFHDNKPSRQVLIRTMELLRHYCMGERACPIEFRSDQTVNFHHSKFPVVNYEDPNYNISIPVFSIHGNHDDPTGQGNLSAMDILSVANLVNYFGKTPNVESIEVSPLLLQKGTTRLALYGLGSCRDERLHRMMRRKNVTFLRPEGEGEESSEEWFSLLVLHQNRAKHGQTNHIPENFIPSFFDLVIWGHEHECRIDAEYSLVGNDVDGEEEGVYISQPGSSVATSLSEGETKKKHIGILYIKGTSFKMEPVALSCIRPFVMDSVILSQSGIHHREEEQITAFLADKVKELVDRANADNPQGKLPLVRLKVEYSGEYETFSNARFGQKFVTEVANPRNILLWYRQRKSTKKKSESPEPMDGVMRRIREREDEDGGGEGLSMPVLVEQQLQSQKLNILSEKNLSEALSQFVDKEDTDAISDFVKYSLEQAQSYLKERPGINEADIDTQISRQREELLRRQEEGASDAHREMSQARTVSVGGTGDNDWDGNTSGPSSTTTTTGGRGRKGSSSGEGRGRGRGGRGRGRGRGSRGGRGGTTGSTRRGSSSTASKSNAAAMASSQTGGGAEASRGGGGGGRRGGGGGRGSDMPTLEFASSRSSSTSRPPKQTRSSTNKKRIVYDESDESEEEDEETFFPPAKKKRTRNTDSPVDLTQDSGSDEERDRRRGVGGGGGVHSNIFATQTGGVRRKR